jgi:hypothetical protein
VKYSTFKNIQRKENVVKPTVRYRNMEDLKRKLDKLVIPAAEAMVLKSA